jgi:hypothetical protein
MYEEELQTAKKLHLFFKAVEDSARVLQSAVSAQATLEDLKREIKKAEIEKKKAVDNMLSAQKQSAQIEKDLEVHKKKFHDEFQELHNKFTDDERALGNSLELRRKALEDDFNTQMNEKKAQLARIQDQIEDHTTKLERVKAEFQAAKSRVLNIAAG